MDQMGSRQVQIFVLNRAGSLGHWAIGLVSVHRLVANGIEGVLAGPGQRLGGQTEEEALLVTVENPRAHRAGTAIGAVVFTVLGGLFVGGWLQLWRRSRARKM